MTVSLDDTALCQMLRQLTLRSVTFPDHKAHLAWQRDEEGCLAATDGEMHYLLREEQSGHGRARMVTLEVLDMGTLAPVMRERCAMHRVVLDRQERAVTRVMQGLLDAASNQVQGPMRGRVSMARSDAGVGLGR